MGEITVRLASDGDRGALADLMIEMQRHYGAEHPARSELISQLSTLPGGIEIFVADVNGRLVGLAAVTSIYPGPGISAGYFLKELYVTDAARSTGVGRALMHELARAACSRGFSRIDWTVGRVNQKAIAFYRSLDADPDPERLFFRLSGEALTRMAEPN